MANIIVNGASEITGPIECEYQFQNKWLVATGGNIRYEQEAGQEDASCDPALKVGVGGNKLTIKVGDERIDLKIPDKIGPDMQSGYIATFLRYLSSIPDDKKLLGLAEPWLALADKDPVLGLHGYEMPEGALCRKILGELLDKGMPLINDKNEAAIADGKGVITKLIGDIKSEMRKVSASGFGGKKREVPLLLAKYLVFFFNGQYRTEIKELWARMAKEQQENYDEMCAEFVENRPKLMQKKEAWVRYSESGLNKKGTNIYDRICYCFNYINGARSKIVEECESGESQRIKALGAVKDCPIDFQSAFGLLKKMDILAVAVLAFSGLALGVFLESLLVGGMAALVCIIFAHIVNCIFVHSRIAREFDSITKSYDSRNRDKINDSILMREVKGVLRLIAGNLSVREKYLRELIEISRQAEAEEVKYPWITVLKPKALDGIDMSDINHPEDCLGNTAEWGCGDGDRMLMELYRPIKEKIRGIAGGFDRSIIKGMGNDQLQEECFRELCDNKPSRRTELTGVIFNKWNRDMGYLSEKRSLEQIADPLLGIWSLGHGK